MTTSARSVGMSSEWNGLIRMQTLSDIDVDVLMDLDSQMNKVCEHPKHGRGQRNHSNEGGSYMVMGLKMPCCGAVPPPSYLCKSWVDSTPVLHCSFCGVNGWAFRDCYFVIGEA